MRIKRFIAPDMRTALRMVRDEQGPDAVILSNRPVEDGIEIVSATDYDESLAQQALRAALPSLPPMPAPVASPLRVPAEAPAAVAAMPAREPAPAMAASPMTAAVSNERPQAPAARDEAKSSRMGSLAALLTKPSKAKPAWTAPVAESAPTVDDHRAALPERAEVEREEPAVVALSDKARSKIAESPIRGRAVFAIGDGTPVITPPRAPKGETLVASSLPAPDTSRFDAMMAALIPQQEKFKATAEAIAAADAGIPAPAPVMQDGVTDREEAAPTAASSIGGAVLLPSADDARNDAAPAPEYRSLADLWADEPVATTQASAGKPAAPAQDVLGEGYPDVAAIVEAAASADKLLQATSVRTHLHAVADQRDPSILAMRDELATMRQLIERELSQLSVERLRGTPARAAAFDALMSYGCDENLAQTIAGRIDARLDPSQIREPLLEELARSLSVARHEPIDDGGVIALVGPTGAGKTTTAAKLAARFAQRHRARDVALVTTDTERPGATEQLHILGRRLGVTVCEANGPEALNEALDQLADYPLVIVDTAGHGLRDRALLGQILWLRAAKRVRSLLVLPANSNAHDLGEVVRRYRPASPEGVVLTKLDETGRLGSALSVLVQHGLSLAYTTDGQQIPHDLAAADARRVAMTLEKVRRAADNPLGSLDSRPLTLPTEDRHAIAS